ncbi:hypothetical protein ALC53_07586 [Atta colombica]|uniref:Uncharacterized protein n=1 Tax=Atta colombica TaxID=520822 RepID=A0A195BCM5_9HYME|nr:hypothetical protein ALC53_07586 [Atta colombica]
MTSGLCAVCSHRRVAPAGGLLEHRAGCSRAALRNVPCHPSRLTSLSSHLQPEEVFSVGAELHRPLCILHPEHILQDERGCGFEEAKRFARDKRICFTAMRRQARETNNNFLSSSVLRLYIQMSFILILRSFYFFLCSFWNKAMLQGHCAMLQSLLRSSIISIYRNPDETLALSTATARLESNRQRSEQQKTHVLDMQVFKFYKLYNNEKAQVAYLIFLLFFAGAQEYQVQYMLADVTVVGIFSTAEYDSVLRIVFHAVGNDALSVLSTCTCLTRPGVRPIVIRLVISSTGLFEALSRLSLCLLSSTTSYPTLAPNLIFHLACTRLSFLKDEFDRGILFAWKISSDTYSLKLKNITRHNLLPTTCQSIEYVARDVSPGMSCGR